MSATGWSSTPAETAHHEAAHAVIAVSLGWRVNYVERTTFQNGETNAEPDGAEDWREFVLILVTGGLGEAIYRGDPGGFGSARAVDERIDAYERAARELRDEATARQHVDAALERRQVLQRPRRWAAVADLAKAILELDRLDETPIRDVLDPHELDVHVLAPSRCSSWCPVLSAAVFGRSVDRQASATPFDRSATQPCAVLLTSRSSGINPGRADSSTAASGAMSSSPLRNGRRYVNFGAARRRDCRPKP